MSLPDRVIEDDNRPAAIIDRIGKTRLDDDQGFDLLETGAGFRWSSIEEQLEYPMNTLSAEAQTMLKTNAASSYVAEMPTILAASGEACSAAESSVSPLSTTSPENPKSATMISPGAGLLDGERGGIRVVDETKTVRQLLQQWNFADAYQRKRTGADGLVNGETSMLPEWIESARAQGSPSMPPVPSPSILKTSLCDSDDCRDSKPRDSAGPFDSTIQTPSERAAGKRRAEEPTGFDMDGQREWNGNRKVRWAEQTCRPTGETRSSLDTLRTLFIGPCSGKAENSPLLETFAYYPPQNTQQLRRSGPFGLGRMDAPEPSVKANKHTKAALCEKVIRNGGTHTGGKQCASAQTSRRSDVVGHVSPFRIGGEPDPITPQPHVVSEHLQQHCGDAYSHTKRCTRPVKTCLDCPTVASGSSSRNRSIGVRSSSSVSLADDAQSLTTGRNLMEAKSPRAFRAKLWAICTRRTLRRSHV